jgi:uncharacterized protein YdbL (DUF1318 family)
MRTGQRGGLATVLGVLALCMACVTVNIYFPAAKVERTADEIVKDVYQGVEKKEPKPGDSSALRLLITWLGPRQAHAAEATTVSNATIRGLKDSIKGRIGQLRKYLDQGNVGIGQNGYLQVRNTDGLGVQQVAEMKRLVNADNDARRRLYQEVAKALNQPDSAPKVENIFAQKWRSEAPGGWWIQTDGGSWQKK